MTNRKKEQSLADAVNAVGTAGWMVAEVKDNWKNLNSTVKKEFATFRRETKKTGDRPAPKLPSSQAHPVRKLLKFSRAHPLSAAWMGLKQVRKQPYCYESCHVTGHCLLVLAVFAHSFWGKDKCGFVGGKDECLILSYKSYLSLRGWAFTAKILCPKLS